MTPCVGRQRQWEKLVKSQSRTASLPGARSVEPAVLHELAGLGDDKAEQEEGEAEAHGDAGHHLVAKAAAAEATTAVAIAVKGMTKQRL